MSVYVDPLTRVSITDDWPFSHSCHLIADTLNELHEFAERLGLKRNWFQNKRVPHYDLTKNKRYQAVRLGAKEITREQFAEIYYRQRRKRHDNS